MIVDADLPAHGAVILNQRVWPGPGQKSWIYIKDMSAAVQQFQLYSTSLSSWLTSACVPSMYVWNSRYCFSTWLQKVQQLLFHFCKIFKYFLFVWSTVRLLPSLCAVLFVCARARCPLLCYYEISRSCDSSSRMSWLDSGRPCERPAVWVVPLL